MSKSSLKVITVENGELLIDGISAGLPTQEDLESLPQDISMTLDQNTYDLTLVLYNKDGEIISSNTVNFPLANLITSATYYNQYTYQEIVYQKVIVIELSTGEITIIPMAGLLSDIQTALSNEVTRATTKENELQTAITNEVTARQSADNTLDTKIEAETTRATTKEGELNTAISSESSTRASEITRVEGLISSEETRATSAEQALGQRIDNLDLNEVGQSGSYIKLISQTNGQVSATAQSFDTNFTTATNNNAPTTKAVKDYVDANGGNINTISVNGTQQPIVNKNVNIVVPTKTSDISNDGDGTSNFATEDYVNNHGGKIDSISIDGVTQTITNKNVDLPAYPTKQSLGLDNVVNTGDSATPVSGGTTKFTTGGAYTLQTTLQGNIDNEESARISVDSDLQDAIGDVAGNLTTHTSDTSNPHSVTKAQVGLGNVDNTSDLNKPISTATQTALNLKANASDLTQEITDRQTADTTIDNKLNVNVHVENNSDEITYNGDTVTKTSPYQNLKTGTTGTRSEVIHLANSTTAGMMSPSDYNQIRTNTSRIEQLEGQTRRLLYTASQNPTQQDIQNFVDNYLISIGITPSPAEYAGIAVVVSGTYHIWHYYDDVGVGWKDDGVDTVSQFTNTIPGIILGKQADGFVFAENDGTGSVYGWSALKTRVSNVETGTVTNVDYDTTNKKITKTINSIASDVVSAATLKQDMNLNNVDNTSDATKKTNFTGSISSGNTGFITGGDAYTALEDKVDKVTGKGLSENDFTTTLLNKLNGIEAGAQVNVQSNWNESDSTSDAYIQNKPSIYTQTEINTLLSGKQNILTFDNTPTANSTNPVTSEGIKSYVDTHGGSIDSISVNGTPQTIDANKNVNITVPTKVSDLTNDSGFITGINSSDITTALGYTPYDSSNPSGFITSSALSGYATQTWVGQQGYLTSIPSNVAYKDSNNNFSTTQTINGNDDTCLALKSNSSSKSNIMFYNSAGTHIGNIGMNSSYQPEIYDKSSSSWKTIALVEQIPTSLPTSDVFSFRTTSTLGGVRLQKNGQDYASVNVALPTSLPANGGNANTVGGYGADVNPTGSTVVVRHSSGYVYATYFHASNGDENNSSAPPRIWGTNGSDHYLRSYNANYVSVGYANSAGSAGSSDLVTSMDSTWDGAHIGTGMRAFYNWNSGGGINGQTYCVGFTVGSNPGDQSYGFEIGQNLWDDRLYIRRYNYPGWQSQYAFAYLSDLGTQVTYSYSGGTLTITTM